MAVSYSGEGQRHSIVTTKRRQALAAGMVCMFLLAQALASAARSATEVSLNAGHGSDGHSHGARGHAPPTGPDFSTVLAQGPNRELGDGAAATAIIHGPNGTQLQRGKFEGPLPRFAQKDIDGNTAGEPMVVFDGGGTAFYSSLVGVEGSFFWHTAVLKSTDDGENWGDVSPFDPASAAAFVTFDPYVYADPVTNRVFSVDWTRDPVEAGVLPSDNQCLNVAFTDDGGSSWDQGPYCPGGDHQTIFSGPPVGDVKTKGYRNVVYLYSNFCGWKSWPFEDAYQSCFTRSLDGGTTWEKPRTVFPRGCFSSAGHGAASWADGTIYIPRVRCEHPGLDSRGKDAEKEGKLNRAEVAVSRDSGETWEVVGVNDRLVRRAAATKGGRQGGAGQHEARVAIDSAGNAYFLFTDYEGRPRLSVSRDQGRTWSKSIAVAAPGVKDTNSNFIGIAAGDPGKIAFTYLGTAGKGDGDELTWNQYVGISLNGLSKRPVFATTTTNATDQPLKRGECAGRCPGTNGSWGMMDFFNIEINPATGMVWTSLVDICTITCDGPGGTSDYEGNQGGVGVQIAGPRLSIRVP